MDSAVLRELAFLLLRPGTVFCLLLRVSSGCARPITGQVTLVTWPVIGWALSELTPSKSKKMGPGLRLNIKTIFPGMGISITKIRQSWDPLDMGILILVRWHLYIGTDPRSLQETHVITMALDGMAPCITRASATIIICLMIFRISRSFSFARKDFFSLCLLHDQEMNIEIQIDGLVHDCSNSIDNALELLQSCSCTKLMKLSKYTFMSPYINSACHRLKYLVQKIPTIKWYPCVFRWWT